jgi:antitoxin component of MazEF toxin-antitoxin module
MPTFFHHKIIRVGDTLGMVIPKDVINSYLLKKGKPITIINDYLEAHGFLIIDLEERSVEELWKILKE